MSDAQVAAVTRAYWPGIASYTAATLMAFVSVAASLLIVAGLAVFYILPRKGAHWSGT